MAAADLAEFRAEWVEPISTDYRGWKVYELPPNGQGMAALEMLNIMETLPLAGLSPVAAWKRCTGRSRRRSWPMPTCSATSATRASEACPWPS